LDLCRLLNDDLAQTVRKHPRRFVGLGTLPLQAPQLAVAELKRCRHELGKWEYLSALMAVCEKRTETSKKYKSRNPPDLVSTVINTHTVISQ